MLDTEKPVESAIPLEVVESGGSVVVVVEEVVELVEVEDVVLEVVVEVQPVANIPEGLAAFFEPEETVKPKLVDAPGASWPFQPALPKR